MTLLLFRALRKTSCLAAVLVFVAISSASASEFFVANSGKDDLQCGSKRNQPCHTIQYAIDDRAVTGDVIQVEEGIYRELVTVDKSLTVRGPDHGEAAIDGQLNGTAVTIPAGFTVTLERLTIRNGQVTSDQPDFSAGGILNSGTLSLVAVIVKNNSAITSQESETPLAGGIVNLGTLTMKFTSILSNSGNGGCSTSGGIINYYATVTIENSEIARNTVAQGPGCFGPGSFPDPSGYLEEFGVTTAYNSTFRHNSITVLGAFTLDRSAVVDSDQNGIFNAGSVVLVNSTIAGSASAGIINDYGELTGTLDMSNSTVAANQGDGVDFGEPLGSTIRNSILAGNSGADCNGDIISGDYNLIQNTSECSWEGGGHDIVGLPAQLRNLGFYGGPTKTMEPRLDSPAINAGNPAGCMDAAGNLLPTDQRGFPRPSPRGGRCDIGAVEVQMHADEW